MNCIRFAILLVFLAAPAIAQSTAGKTSVFDALGNPVLTDVATQAELDAAVLSSGGVTLTSSWIGYGSGSNTVTGEPAFTYDALNNAITVGTVSLGGVASINANGSGIFTLYNGFNNESINLNFGVGGVDTVFLTSDTGINLFDFGTVAAKVPQEAYDATGWNNNLTAPTKDAVRDVMETKVSTSGVVIGTRLAAYSGTSGTLLIDSGYSTATLRDRTNHTGTQAWTTLTGLPTTLAGYGITDAQGLDADLTDLADGSLTGSKVGTGIDAANITTGTVAAARLGSGTPTSSTYLNGLNQWVVPSGTGDVAKVGTPVDNQIGVWTGNGTLEGDANLTFDTATDTLTTGTLTVTTLNTTNLNAGNLIFEGSVADDFETTLAVTNPTAGRTWTFPDVTDTVVGIAATQTLLGKTINLASNTLTATSAQLGTALTDETGTGLAVFATSPTLTTPNLGTPSAATLTNATGLPIASGVSGLGTGVATALTTPSSTNLAAAVTDEVGTGSLMFTRTGVRRTVYVNAGAMIPVAGATATTAPVGTNIKYDAIDFDSTTSERAGFWFTFPTTWDTTASITIKLHWVSAGGTATNVVAWQVGGLAVPDGTAIDTAVATFTDLTEDGMSATGQLQITATSGNLAFTGTKTANAPCFFEIKRKTSALTGTNLASDARLLGASLEFTESVTEPAAQ